MKNKKLVFKADLVLKSDEGDIHIHSSSDSLIFEFSDFLTTAFFLNRIGFEITSILKYLSFSRLLNQKIEVYIASRKFMELASGKIRKLRLLHALKLLINLLKTK